MSDKSYVSFLGLSAVEQIRLEHMLCASPFVRRSAFKDESQMTFRELQDQAGRRLRRWLQHKGGRQRRAPVICPGGLGELSWRETGGRASSF